jgi:hypothetical protein
MEREQEAELQRQRQIVERKRAALQSQIFVVTATYRRTQAELNALIVEVRRFLKCPVLFLFCGFGDVALFDVLYGFESLRSPTLEKLFSAGRISLF